MLSIYRLHAGSESTHDVSIPFSNCKKNIYADKNLRNLNLEIKDNILYTFTNLLPLLLKSISLLLSFN